MRQMFNGSLNELKLLVKQASLNGKWSDLAKGHIQIPSDIEGVIRYGYNNHVKEVIPKLAQRLNEVGFSIDSSQIADASQ